MDPVYIIIIIATVALLAVLGIIKKVKLPGGSEITFEKNERVVKIKGKIFIDASDIELFKIRVKEIVRELLDTETSALARQMDHSENMVKSIAYELLDAYRKLDEENPGIEDTYEFRWRFMDGLLSGGMTNEILDRLKDSFKKNGYYTYRKALPSGEIEDLEGWDQFLEEKARQYDSLIRHYLKNKVPRQLCPDVQIILDAAQVDLKKVRGLMRSVFGQSWEIQHQAKKAKRDLKEEEEKLTNLLRDGKW